MIKKMWLGDVKDCLFIPLDRGRGLGVSSSPCYVRKKNMKKNTLLITADKRRLESSCAYFRKIHWMSGGFKNCLIRATVRMGYRHLPARAVLNRVRDEFYRGQV